MALYVGTGDFEFMFGALGLAFWHIFIHVFGVGSLLGTADIAEFASNPKFEILSQFTSQLTNGAVAYILYMNEWYFLAGGLALHAATYTISLFVGWFFTEERY